MKPFPVGLEAAEIVNCAEEDGCFLQVAVDGQQGGKADHVVGAAVALLAAFDQRRLLLREVTAPAEKADQLAAGGFGIAQINLGRQRLDVVRFGVGELVKLAKPLLHVGVAGALLGKQLQSLPGLRNVTGLLVETLEQEQRALAAVACTELGFKDAFGLNTSAQVSLAGYEKPAVNQHLEKETAE